MAEGSRFDFCPKCGALARDGVCQSCGYENPKVIQEIQREAQARAEQNRYSQQAGYGQNMQYYQQVQLGQQAGYVQYNPSYSYVPAGKPQKSSTGKTVAVICAVVAIAAALIVALFLVCISLFSGKTDEGNSDKFGSRNGYGEVEDDLDSIEDREEDTEEDFDMSADKEGYTYYEADTTEDNRQEEGQDPDYPFYSGPYNALKDDLSYEVEFTLASCYSEDGTLALDIEYPQIVSGNIPNQDRINEFLCYEYAYFLSVMQDDLASELTAEDSFNCQVDAYVTYMDEKILSVVYKEYLYLQMGSDYDYALNYYCLNFDLETGTLLENTEIVRLDEDFAIDFRMREIEENGDEVLTEYSDQEILEMLKDSTMLVMFYTPMGLEVGLNLDDVIVYVMYADYEQYLNSF